MTEREHIFVALCRSCEKPFQGTLRWEDTTGDIIVANSTLISRIQKHHNTVKHIIGSHNNYGLFLNEQQMEETQCDFNGIVGPLGFLVVSSQCLPLGMVNDEEIKET